MNWSASSWRISVKALSGYNGPMQLKQVLAEAEAKKKAIGHFNISDSSALLGIFEAAKELGVPVLIGTSEGERDFVSEAEAVALVKALRETHGYPIFLNADHTHSLEKVKRAVEAGYDAVLFDGGKLSFEENIQKTKEVVAYVKSVNPEILVEGELGYIGSSSQILKDIPEGAAIKPEDLTKPEEAAQFVKETGVDLLAPAVGNLHGMFANAPSPKLDISRIAAIKAEAKVPLVLHGGSGTTDSDFLEAIRAGITIVHINTEIRKGWADGIRAALTANPEEIVPYKILGPARQGVKDIVKKRLELFGQA
jgi:fructose-bisphosphate aldolase, class II